MKSLPGSSLDLRDRQLREVDRQRHGGGLDLRSRSAPSAASACGRCRSLCRSCRADFGIARADASLPYTLAMTGFALGGVAMGLIRPRP